MVPRFAAECQLVLASHSVFALGGIPVGANVNVIEMEDGYVNEAKKAIWKLRS